MPSKMNKEDANNNPLGEKGDKIDSGTPGDEGLRYGEGGDNSDFEEAADEAEFLYQLIAICNSDITIAEEKSRLITLIKIKPQPKDRGEQEPSVGERVEEEKEGQMEKEKADYPTQNGEYSSNRSTHSSKFVARSKSETDIALSTIGDDKDKKEVTNDGETKVKIKKKEAIRKAWRKMKL